MSIRCPQNAFKQFDCCMCGQHFDRVETLESHLASVHVFYMVYECDTCTDALFPSEFALREHYTKIHNKNTFMVKYRVSPELDERREMLRRLVDQSIHKSNGTIPQNKGTNLESDSYTSQLLKNCTSLLQTQLIASNHFLTNSSKKGQDEWEKDSDDANGHFGSGDGAAELHSIEGIFSKIDDRLFPLPMDSLNLDKINDVKLEIKASPIKKHTKRQRKIQKNIGNDQMQANYSQSSNEEAKQQQKGPMVECSGCKRMVGQYRNSMLIHVSTHHCDLPIFECLADGCGKKWYSISARTKEHIEAKHGGDYKFLQDNRSSLLPFLRSTAVRLFPGDY